MKWTDWWFRVPPPPLPPPRPQVGDEHLRAQVTNVVSLAARRVDPRRKP